MSALKNLPAASVVALLVVCGCRDRQPDDDARREPAATGRAARIAVVEGEYTARALPSEAGATRSCHRRVGACLDAAGIPWAALTDSAVEEGKLAGFDTAVFPYNARLSDREVAEIRSFVASGGKLLWFYTLDRRLATLLGLTIGELRKPAYDGQFSRLGFPAGGPGGLPASVLQDSWHALDVVPAKGTEVIGYWRDAGGRDTELPAATLNANGVWFAHVLLSGDLSAKSQMLLALLGHFTPSLWETAVGSAVSRACRVSTITTLDGLRARLTETKDEAPNYPEALRELREAETVRDEAVQLGRETRYREALGKARGVRQHALAAYEFGQPSRTSEFRGVWIHTAYGVSNWGWERSIRVLAENGFNAILPNMCWAGKADYYSRVLPVTAKARERGDQLAECTKWARRYGVEVHVWKVCYDLSTAPNSFVTELRRQGRLQKGRNGRELSQKWLCPSNTANIELERDSLLEVVRNYRVAGVHLDYIRYPSSAGCYCDNCRRAFEAGIGRRLNTWPNALDAEPFQSEWRQFRRDQITRLVRAVKQGLRRRKSAAKLSAAVYGSWKGAREGIAQDAKAWVDEGLLDFVCPMNYTDSLGFQSELTTQQARALYGRVPLYAGIGVHSAQSDFTSPHQLLEQIEAVRRGGADGFAVFQYRAALAEEFFPALKRGATAKPAVSPHNAPPFGFRLRGGSPAFDSPTFRVGEPLTATLRPPAGPGPAGGELVLDSVQLLRLDGSFVTECKRKPGPTSPFVVSVSPGEGWYRFGVSGTARTRAGRSTPFLWKGPLIHVAHPALVDAEEWKDQPPPKGRGLRVGLWQNGFGSTGVFIALRRERDLLPFYIRDTNPGTLSQCRAVVIAQPKRPEDFPTEAAERLRRWVERGGGLLLTHDACGYRQCPSLFGALWRATGHSRGRTVEVARPHPLTHGIEAAAPFQHSYHDHLQLGVRAPAVAVVVCEPEGTPVVAAATVGKGRVVGCGLALGLAPDDEDVEPGPAEAALVRNAVRWLAAR
jgi:uncharacterized lipoprotein YddW (UPF0748 family)